MPTLKYRGCVDAAHLNCAGIDHRDRCRNVAGIDEHVQSSKWRER